MSDVEFARQELSAARAKADAAQERLDNEEDKDSPDPGRVARLTAHLDAANRQLEEAQATYALLVPLAQARQEKADITAELRAERAKGSDANERELRRLEAALLEAGQEVKQAQVTYDKAVEARVSKVRKRARDEADDTVTPVDWLTMGRPVAVRDLPRSKEELEAFLQQDLLVKFPVPGPDLALPDSFKGSFYTVNGGLTAVDNNLCSGATGPLVDQPQTDADTENMLQRYTDNSIFSVLVALRGEEQDGERRSKRYLPSAR